MLHKLLGTRVGQCLSLHLCQALFKCGALSLKFYNLLFESLRLVSEKVEMLAHDGSRTALRDQSVDGVKK